MSLGDSAKLRSENYRVLSKCESHRVHTQPPLRSLHRGPLSLAADYQVHLQAIEAFAESTSANTCTVSVRTRYHRLNTSRITKHLNDANLCIRALHCEKEAIHEGDLTGDMVKAIDDAAKATKGLLRRLVFILLPGSTLSQNNIRKTPGVYAEHALDGEVERFTRERGCSTEEVRELLLEMMKQLNSSFKLTEVYPKREYTYYLHRWDSILVSFASRLELLLADLAVILSQNRGGGLNLAEDFMGLSIDESSR